MAGSSARVPGRATFAAGGRRGYGVRVELVVLVGLQGAGKSTFFRERFAATHALVSRDLFRNAPRPARRQRALVEEAAARGRPVVVDNTSPTRADRAALIALARELGLRPVCYFFPPDVRASIARNAAREGKARVPVVAILATAKRLEPPTRDEGFDQVFEVRPRDGGGFEVRAVTP
jgi:predicted kinase